MKQSDAKRQAAYRRRMRDRGYIQMRDWVHADDLNWIRDQIITRNAWRDACLIERGPQSGNLEDALDAAMGGFERVAARVAEKMELLKAANNSQSLTKDQLTRDE